VSELAAFMAEEPEAEDGTSKREMLKRYYTNKWDERHNID
jgi:hypothetical protein